jgi:hypothetical protein
MLSPSTFPCLGPQVEGEAVLKANFTNQVKPRDAAHDKWAEVIHCQNALANSLTGISQCCFPKANVAQSRRGSAGEIGHFSLTGWQLATAPWQNLKNAIPVAARVILAEMQVWTRRWTLRTETAQRKGLD